MPDHRTLRQKLEAMANQTRSPKEAAIARAHLERRGWTQPERPQTQGRPTRRGDSPFQRYANSAATGAASWSFDLKFFEEQVKRMAQEIAKFGNCPGCKHPPSAHAGGICYDCYASLSMTMCRWQILSTGWYRP